MCVSLSPSSPLKAPSGWGGADKGRGEGVEGTSVQIPLHSYGVWGARG